MQPYITFVVAARNDNYGGDFLARMQVFLNSTLALWWRYQLDAELVVVEWNPPAQRASLRHALKWPLGRERARVRIIEVPNEYHRQLMNCDRMPMFEYIAKNAGIRRASGRYVLATNPDLLFSEALIDFLASERLEQNRFYRIDRYDVDQAVPQNLTTEQQLRFCEEHVFKIATHDGHRPMARERWPSATAIARVGRAAYRVVVSRKLRAEDLHTNAAGDFFLMARDHWIALRGYPELTTHSFIDGYICFMAAARGLRQVVLRGPMKIYHQEHNRLEHANRPLTDYAVYREHGRRMLESGTPEILNDERWGLGGVELQEYPVGP